MKKIQLLLIGLLMFPLSALVAQQIDLKAQYGQQTYDQFLAEDWSGLISTGKEAIEQGVDFYYLRLRLGIAYGAQFNYRMAIVNYKKALDFVPNDPVAQEYLYYAYLYAGMKNSSSLYAAKLPVSLRKKIKAENLPFIGNIYMETGYAIADYENKNIELPVSDDIYFSEIFSRKSQTYYNFNLLLNLGKPISLNIAYTGLSLQSDHNFLLKGYNEGNIDLKVSQSDLYAALNIHDDNGLTLIPFFHNVNTSLAINVFEYDTAAYELEPNIDIDFIASLSQLQWNDPLVGFGFLKRSGKIDLAASISYSWLGESEQQQINASLTYLPRGNYALFFTPEIRYFKEDETSRMIYKFKTGWSFSSKVWAETAFTYGDLKSTHESFGAIVYNLPDNTKYKVDAVINYGFGNGVSLSLRYQLTQKESALTTNSLVTTSTGGGFGGGGFNTTETNWLETETFYPFKQHFIILGFNWTL